MTRNVAILIVGLLSHCPVSQGAVAPVAQNQRDDIPEVARPMPGIIPSYIAFVDSLRPVVARMGFGYRCAAVLLSTLLFREVVFLDKPILLQSLPLFFHDPARARGIQLKLVISVIVILERVGDWLQRNWVDRAQPSEQIIRPFALGAAFNAALDCFELLWILSFPQIAMTKHGLDNPIVFDTDVLVGRIFAGVAIRALLGLWRPEDRADPLAALKDTAKAFAWTAGVMSLFWSAQAIFAFRHGGVALATVPEIATFVGAATLSWLATRGFPNLFT